jgi:hypothetical protein
LNKRTKYLNFRSPGQERLLIGNTGNCICIAN